MNNGLFLSENIADNKFNSFMIKRFQPEGEKFRGTNLLRYHYTSANALLKILGGNSENACVRFTDVRYLNDKSEMLFFVKRLLEFLAEHRNEYQFCYEIVSQLLLKKHTEDEYINLEVPKIEFTVPENFPLGRSRNFVFCTCGDPDSLNMWNYYVQNGEYQGYGIGINLYEFLKSFDIEKDQPLDPILFYYGEVIYSKTKQMKEIKAICDTIEKKANKAQNDNYTFQIAMYELYMYICSYGMFFKQEGFSQEKEYRVLIEITESRVNSDRANYTNKYNKEIRLGFYERKGIVVPCLEVPFEKNAIKKITIAPIMEKEIAYSGLKEFLTVNGYDKVEIGFSNIPIRY